jgi:hypothetical protein
MMNCTYLDAKQKFALYAPAFSGRSRLEPTLRDRAGFANVEGSDFLNQMLYLDTKIFMASLNRTYNDMRAWRLPWRFGCRSWIVNWPSSWPERCRRS